MHPKQSVAKQYKAKQTIEDTIQTETNGNEIDNINQEQSLKTVIKACKSP